MILSPPGAKDHRQTLKRKFRKLPMRILYTSRNGPFLKHKEGSRERRFIPLKQFPCSGSLTIYGNKVALVSQNKHLAGMIIDNKEMAGTLRALFYSAWKSAKIKN